MLFLVKSTPLNVFSCFAQGEFKLNQTSLSSLLHTLHSIKQSSIICKCNAWHPNQSHFVSNMPKKYIKSYLLLASCNCKCTPCWLIIQIEFPFFVGEMEKKKKKKRGKKQKKTQLLSPNKAQTKILINMRLLLTLLVLQSNGICTIKQQEQKENPIAHSRRG